MVPTSPMAGAQASPADRRNRSARGLAKWAVPKALAGTSAAPRGVVCEMAGVLYDATLWRREVVKLLARLGIAASFPQFFEPWQRQYRADVQRGFRQFEEAFQAFLLSAGLSWAQIDEIEATSRIRRQQLEEGIRPFPGVRTAIAQLAKRGLKLAVLADSHYPADALREQLERLGLGGKFHSVVTSLALEAVKPAPQCYRTVAAALEIEAEELAFVSCDQASLAGAQACGMRTVAIHAPLGVEADARISKFGELVEVVGRWSGVALARGQA